MRWLYRCVVVVTFPDIPARQRSAMVIPVRRVGTLPQGRVLPWLYRCAGLGHCRRGVSHIGCTGTPLLVEAVAAGRASHAVSAAADSTRSPPKQAPCQGE